MHGGAHSVYAAFGLNIASDFPLPGLEGSAEGDADVAIRWGPSPLVAEMTPVWRSQFSDGRLIVAEAAADGSQRLRFGDDAIFALSSNAATVWCDVADSADPAWQRFLLDTVLWWICLSRGLEVLHACALDFGGA